MLNKKFLKIFITYLVILIVTTNNIVFAFDCGPAGGTEAFANKKAVEKGPNSTIFIPTLKLYYKLCGFWACGCHTKELKGYGECAYVEGLRFCARAAGRHEHGNNSDKVQICAYQDPWDDMDTNANLMPFHHNASTKGTDSTASNASTATGILVGSAVVLMPFTLGMSAVVLGIAAGISELISFARGSWNHIVTSNVGCVDIPRAPFPPPFCATLPSIPPEAYIQKICANGESPTFSNQCLLTKNSTSVNNIAASESSFEKPLVRVSYKNYVQICNEGNPKEPCVKLCNAPTDINEAFHNSSKDIVKICSSTDNKCPSDSEFCAIFNGEKLSTATELQLVYTLSDQYNTQSAQTSWHKLEFNSETNPTSFKIYGVNDSDFYDLSYSFSMDQGNATPSSKSLRLPISINEKSQNIKYVDYAAYIDLDHPMEICVKDKTNNKNLGCVDRAAMPKPQVARCGDTNGLEDNCLKQIASNCTSENSSPTIAVGFGNPMQCGKINIPYNSKANTSSLTLHGIKFSAVATNENYTLPTATEQSISGTYENTSAGSTYVKGLEYQSGNYIRGASQICLTGYETDEKILSNLVINKATTQSNGSIAYSKVDPSTYCSLENPDQVVYITSISDRINDRIYPNPLINPLYNTVCKNSNGTLKTMPSCPVGEECCNSCNSWKSGNNLDNNGKCLPGYFNVAKMLVEPYSKFDLLNLPTVCLNSNGGSRIYTSCPDGESCYNTCIKSSDSNSSKINIATLVNPCREGIRGKNPLELSLCTTVPPSFCPEITINEQEKTCDQNGVCNYTDTYGYATWPKTAAGETANGKCLTGYSAKNGTPKLKCYPSLDNKNWYGKNIVNPCVPDGN
ncbi:MAG: hypothetical protein ACK4OM_06470 [Alphaproteobacteria bacterium]